jgi:hypothetical protein
MFCSSISLMFFSQIWLLKDLHSNPGTEKSNQCCCLKMYSFGFFIYMNLIYIFIAFFGFKTYIIRKTQLFEAFNSYKHIFMLVIYVNNFIFSIHIWLI